MEQAVMRSAGSMSMNCGVVAAEETAHGVAFLLPDAASAMAGASLVVDRDCTAA